MTCGHVLALIDAGDFADYPRAHLDAAWRHARQCATCGPALDAMTACTKGLAALPQPSPPGDLLATVVARIEQIEREQSDPLSGVVPPVKTASRGHDWLASVTLLGGFAVSLAIVLAMALGESAPIGAGWSKLGVVTSGMPSTAADTLILAAGLAVYVAGLLAPLRGRSKPRATC